MAQVLGVPSWEPLHFHHLKIQGGQSSTYPKASSKFLSPGCLTLLWGKLNIRICFNQGMPCPFAQLMAVSLPREEDSIWTWRPSFVKNVMKLFIKIKQVTIHCSQRLVWGHWNLWQMLKPRILRIMENNKHWLNVDLDPSLKKREREKQKRFSIEENLGGGPLMKLFIIEDLDFENYTMTYSTAFLGHNVLGYLYGAHNLCAVKRNRLCIFLDVNWEDSTCSGQSMWLMPGPLLTWHLEDSLMGTAIAAANGLLQQTIRFPHNVTMALLDKSPQYS